MMRVQGKRVRTVLSRRFVRRNQEVERLGWKVRGSQGWHQDVESSSAQSRSGWELGAAGMRDRRSRIPGASPATPCAWPPAS